LLEAAGMPPNLPGVRVPTLVTTGEAGLDRVVPPHATLEYLRLWPHAQVVTLKHTGHIGQITHAEDFARIVVGFAETAEGNRERRVG
jgi:pimeloyl-ACP methyl ester carboxylesterase